MQGGERNNKMPSLWKCAQPKVIDTHYNENGWTIEVVRFYKCGCGKWFVGTSYYECKDYYETIEKLPKERN